MKFILGKKLEMSQKFKDDGTVVPVTAVLAGPCVVTQLKTDDKDGYTAIQIGFGFKRKLNKPEANHLKPVMSKDEGLKVSLRYLNEFRLDGLEKEVKVGDEIKVDSFQVGDKIKITGTSKGKGFQGVVKRHGFHGSPASHGHKDQLRMPGSIGATGPARVFKGTRLPGRMGGDQISVKNLEIIEIDSDKNILFIKGAVPGARNGLVKIVSQAI